MRTSASSMDLLIALADYVYDKNRTVSDSQNNDKFYAAQHKGAQVTIQRQQERIRELEAELEEMRFILEGLRK